MITRSRRNSLLIAAMTVAVSVQAQETLRLTPTNGRVAIWNLTGQARIEQGSSSDVEVQITPRGPDASRMITQTGSLDGQQTLRIFYPSDDVRPAGVRRDQSQRWSTTFTMGDDGRFGDDRHRGGRRMKIGSHADFEASADLVIRVPKAVSLDLHVASGDVSASAAVRAMLIDTYSGDVATTNTAGVLRIDTGSGDVVVETHSGDLNVDTGSGDVEVRDVTDAATIMVDTGSGNVLADRCRATADLTIDTGSGRVSARNVEARNIKLDTGSGAVDVSPTAATESLHVDTGSGAVTLIVPSSFGAALEVSSGSAGIRSDVPLTVLRQDRDELSARIGDGRTRVSIDTGSGGVTIRGRI
jgi:lia operon protein LiaG